jgi:predicted nucleotidyltransferase
MPGETARLARSDATRYVEEVLRRVAAGHGLNRLVTAVWVFGSFRRGAEEVGDVDLIATYDATDPEWQSLRSAAHEEWLRRGMPGGRRDSVFKIEQAMVRGRGRWVVVEIVQTEDDLHPPEVFEERLLLYRRGDDLSLALERLRAIEVVPGAGRRRVSAVPTELEWLDRRISRLSLEQLADLSRRQVVAVERLRLATGTPSNPRSGREIADRWRSSSSSRKRAAALAAAAWWETDQSKASIAARRPLAGSPSPRLRYDTQRGALIDRHGSLVIKIGGNWSVEGVLFFLTELAGRSLRGAWVAVLDPNDGPPWETVLIRPGRRLQDWTP